MVSLLGEISHLPGTGDVPTTKTHDLMVAIVRFGLGVLPQSLFSNLHPIEIVLNFKC